MKYMSKYGEQKVAQSELLSVKEGTLKKLSAEMSLLYKDRSVQSPGDGYVSKRVIDYNVEKV